MEIVSCIVLCYKNFRYIYGALDSVMKQDYPAIEMIVSDDGSPDFPKQQIIDYIEANKGENIIRYQVYSNETNVGTVRNYNGAVSRASGEYIAPLACDDEYFDSSVISNIVKRFGETNAELLVCRRMLCDEKSMKQLGYLPNNYEMNKISQLDTAKKQHTAFVTGRFYNLASGSIMYYRKKTLSEYGLFDKRFRLWEDGPAIAALTAAGVFLTTAYDIVSVKYREGGVSTGNIRNPVLLQDEKILYDEDILPNIEQFSKAERKMIFFKYGRNYHYRNMSKIEKLKFLIKYSSCIIKRRIPYYMGKWYRRR